MSSRIAILGSCSGTEPYAGRHHTSWIFETEKSLYWFDAGECCVHTAYVSGLDVRKSRCVFISHPHSDHVGGLLNLLTCIRKMQYVTGYSGKMPEILTPAPRQAEKILEVLEAGGEKLSAPPRIAAVSDGCVYEDHEISVEARHNTHMGTPADGVWKSFSFRIRSAFGIIISSGDTGSIRELEEWLPGADLFLMETGHHDPLEVCRFLKEKPDFSGQLVFFHHGRRILNAEDDSLRQECCAVLGRNVIFAHDAQVLAGDPFSGYVIAHRK